MLSREDIRRALLALAGELQGTSERCEIVIVGGAAVVLLYGAREATKDVDVLILSSMEPAIVREAVRRTSRALDLPEDWLNDAAKGYIHGLALGEVILDEPSLLVRTLAPQQLLASSPGARRRHTTRSVIFGRPNMDLRDLVRAILSYDALTARQWVADSMRQGVVWTTVPEPTDLDEIEMGVAAGVVELLASRAGQASPSWTRTVEPSPTPVYLVKAARTMPRLRQLCEEEGPEPLRRRGILAPPEFLKVA